MQEPFQAHNTEQNMQNLSSRNIYIFQYKWPNTEYMNKMLV